MTGRWKRLGIAVSLLGVSTLLCCSGGGGSGGGGGGPSYVPVLPGADSSGAAFANPSRITFSFAPDGTDVWLGTASTLFSGLNALFATATWQTAIAHAFQTWAVNSNLNFGLVSDGGQAMGIAGLLQGDSRFGDIRVGGYDLGTGNALAGLRFGYANDSSAGDIRLSPGAFGGGSPVDLFTAALYAVGHALGLSDNSDPLSAMSTDLSTTKSALTAQDIAAVQAIYGTRSADAYDASASNETPVTASLIATGTLVSGDLTTSTDKDNYRCPLPATTNFTATLTAAGNGLLVPKLTVLTAGGTTLATSSGVSPLNNNAVANFTTTSASTYYFVVEKKASDDYAIGSYTLWLATSGSPSDPPPGDQGNHAVGTALPVSPTISVTGRRFFKARATLTAGTADYYRVTAPVSGAPFALVAGAWAASGSTLYPAVRLLDASGNALSFQTLAAETSTQSAQASGTAASTNYLVEVSARDSADASHNSGEYFLSAQFGSAAEPIVTFVSSATLPGNGSTHNALFHVEEDQVFHFLITGTNASSGALSLVVSDLSSTVHFSSALSSNGSRSVTFPLAAGDYIFQFALTGSGPQTIAVKGLAVGTPLRAPGAAAPSNPAYQWLSVGS